MSLSGFDVGKCWLIEWVRKHALFFFILEEIVNKVLFLPQAFVRSHQWNYLGMVLFFLFGSFLIIALVSLIDMRLFRLSISPWVLIACALQRMGQFHISHQICGHKVVLNITLSSFLSMASVVTMLLSFLLLLICDFFLILLAWLEIY